MTKTKDAVVHCQNCNAILLGDYCHQCAQARRSPLRQLPIFINDWVMEVLDLDKRVMPSISKLLFRPGKLTAEYWQGQRAGQVHPIRSYLILNVLYFALLTMFNTKGFLGGMIHSSEAEFVKVMPKLMIIMVPMFALILHGLYRHSQRLYTEHFVFSLHYFCFYFLFLIVSKVVAIVLTAILPAVAAPWIIKIESLAQIYNVVYLSLALKACYGQPLKITLTKTFASVMIYLVCLVMFALMVEAVV